MSNKCNKVAFFDRDGIVNKELAEGKYATSWEEFRFLPDVFRTLKYIKSRGYLTILITNQKAIAGKLMTEQELLYIHERMQTILNLHDCFFDRIFYCPHDIKDKCDCRKPRPGLLKMAEQYYAIDKANSFMIGDSANDIEAGRGYGVKTIRVGAWGTLADYSVEKLKDILDIVI